MPQTIAARFLAQLRSSPTGWCGVCHADPVLNLRPFDASTVECIACGARATLRDEERDHIAATWTGDRKGGPT